MIKNSSAYIKMGMHKLHEETFGLLIKSKTNFLISYILSKLYIYYLYFYFSSSIVLIFDVIFH